MADAIRALLGRLVDDAAQFPPARLALDDAVTAHREARAGQWSWMLGRFLCPASRLGERSDLPRPLGVIGDGDPNADLDAAIAAGAETFELRDPGPELYPLLRGAPLDVFVEGAAALTSVRDAGLAAKLRCGGLTADAFPSDRAVAEFIGECRALGLPFKLTAGLHHPFRTQDAEIGVLQHGFVNLLAATILDVDADTRCAIVAEPDPAAFTVSPDGVGWHGEWARFEAIQRGRANLTSIGCCSFEEFHEGLLAHGILDAALHEALGPHGPMAAT